MESPTIKVRRAEARGAYDRETIDSILDEGLVAHMGLVEDGYPVVIPVSYARVGDHVYIHGSPASRLFRAYAKGAKACLEVTLLDGIVLARSAFNHSMNYRSVVMFGEFDVIEEWDEKVAALEALTDAIVPGRRPSLRPMSEKEIRSTTVLRMKIDRVSAKARTGPPGDPEDEWDVWTGVIPVTRVFGDPVPSPEIAEGTAVPAHAAEYRR